MKTIPELIDYPNIIDGIPHYPQCKCTKIKKPLRPNLRVAASDPVSCSRILKLQSKLKFPQNSLATYCTLLSLSSSRKNLPQIDLDISRTFHHIEYFSNEIGKNTLIRLLNTFITYNPSLGYVQGMNYIAATLLWHAREVDAFWLFVILIEDFELRDNFSVGFPGLIKHFHVLDFLISDNLPDVYSHMLDKSVSVQMFATEWFMTLFTSTIPIKYSFRVLLKFFKKGWIFFYKLCLEIIKRLSGKILKSENLAAILNTLKPTDHSKRQWKVFVKNMEKGTESNFWKRLIKNAIDLDIPERFLSCLFHNASNIQFSDAIVEEIN